jgi:hypothetical protein
VFPVNILDDDDDDGDDDDDDEAMHKYCQQFSCLILLSTHDIDQQRLLNMRNIQKSKQICSRPQSSKFQLSLEIEHSSNHKCALVSFQLLTHYTRHNSFQY